MGYVSGSKPFSKLFEAALLVLLPSMGLNSSGFCMPLCLLLHSEILLTN
jgi:hypothetical protein